jgi:predicted phosphodiesterase
MNKIETENIYVLGDTHTLDFARLLRHYEAKDFVLIHVGDVGCGFHTKERDHRDVAVLEEYCAKHNGIILAQRGNHDDPSWFVEDSEFSTEHVKFVPDYSYYDINGKIYLFVGGATSIDRLWRIQQEKKCGSVSYWKDEKFVLREDYESLPQCDILITHSSPISAYPLDGLSKIKYFLENDQPLKGELISEREDIDKLYKVVNPSILLHGHFHESVSEYVAGTWQRCLDINELISLTNYLQ